MCRYELESVLSQGWELVLASKRLGMLNGVLELELWVGVFYMVGLGWVQYGV